MPCLRTSFASAEIRAASPTATRRPRLAQPRPPLLAHREISFRKGRNSLCDLLEIRDLQWSFGPPTTGGYGAVCSVGESSGAEYHTAGGNTDRGGKVRT